MAGRRRRWSGRGAVATPSPRPPRNTRGGAEKLLRGEGSARLGSVLVSFDDTSIRATSHGDGRALRRELSVGAASPGLVVVAEALAGLVDTELVALMENGLEIVEGVRTIAEVLVESDGVKA